MHPEYLLKLFQFFFKYWIFIYIIQYIPVYGLGEKEKWQLNRFNAHLVRFKTHTMVNLPRETGESQDNAGG